MFLVTFIALEIAIKTDQQRLILKVFGKHIGILSRDPVPFNDIFPKIPRNCTTSRGSPASMIQNWRDQLFKNLMELSLQEEQER
jgi:hypothetical protein